MTQDEMKKVFIVEKLSDHQITTQEATTALGISTRQVLRLKNTYKQEGAFQICSQESRQQTSTCDFGAGETTGSSPL